ncbi:MAG: AAA family ATPase [Saprospiraceae bacterium]|nr:AAA family ATPase [Saprospiraceae bacterium]MCF8252586.1 AAA family ATPase [Saprospiraceae bacterium]MCF8282627.1 AAA family ATPase [Bacteroidales bacterium]MCF8314172.1 AAA family ATPase [Saprospiraceae bacterium]MCF8442938.1 AAA family ATPase [Saprospiraceae bacterium]
MTDAIAAELQQLSDLLKLEKQKDFEHFQAFVLRLPLSERVAEGYAWHPVEVEKSGYTYGERAFVTVVRTKASVVPHQFRAGQSVRFFTAVPQEKQAEKSGVIHSITKGRMKIVLGSKDLPEWINAGSLGVDLEFDERTYVEMEKALKKVKEATGNRLAELRSIIFGNKAASFLELPAVHLPQLNDAQNSAVNEILAAQDVAVVHGPPGTGKTTTLVQAIRLLCKTENTVLVCAPSNSAADLLTERLVDEGLQVLRIGNISRVEDKIVQHTLESQIAAHPESKNIKKVRLEAVETRRQAMKFKRKFGHEQRQERGHLFRQAGELSGWANHLEDQLVENILDSAQVITCTLVGSVHKALGTRTFRTVVIDEAAQALEPATWIPITRATKVVLAGDPFQLPPTVKSEQARRSGFGNTMIEKCMQRLPRTSLLTVQYRMNHRIMEFSNQWFYEGKLTAAAGVAEHQLDMEHPSPVIFIDTAGTGFEEQFNEKSQSRYNPDEFQLLCEHLYQLISGHDDKDLPSIALISPYKEQVMHMQDTVAEDSRLRDIALDINTIDGFQGQERDVVYISLVRSNPKCEIGFLNDYRRMNVAMTRARKLLVIVGDSATVGADPFYQAMLDYCEAHGGYETAWAFMV